MRFRHLGPVAQAAVALAVWVVIITLSPVILLVGEPVNRYVRQRLCRSASITRAVDVRTGNRSAWAVTPVRLSMPSSLLLTVISNPLWIALTAPGRWVADKFSTPPSPGRS